MDCSQKFKDRLEAHYNEHKENYIKIFSKRFPCAADSEDAVQTAYCKALRLHKTYREDSNFDGWMQTCIQNAVTTYANMLKNKGGSVNIDEILLEEKEVGYDEDAVEAFNKYLSHLDEDTRGMAYDYFILGLTPREISAKSDKTAAYMADKIRRFKEKFRQVNLKDFE